MQSSGVPAFGELVITVAWGALVLCGCWLLVVTSAAFHEQLTGSSTHLLTRVTPAAIRRLAALVCGAAVAGGLTCTTAASATTPPATAPPVTTAEAGPAAAVPGAVGGLEGVITGLSLPDRTASTAPAPSTGAPARPSVPSEPVETSKPDKPSETATYRVRPGDCLWDIARRRLLPADASVEDVDAAWRVLHRRNRAVIGADPDLLRPGTLLRLPPSA
jgi:nucleoid-associated protein YgaU